MDESFADLGCLGQSLQTNIEIAPFISSLSENTIHGNALSSVFGGGTPNSEYEFLTGNSLFFLPEGTYVYSQYLKTPVYSMVSELNSLGYRTVGAHPYYPTGWNRDMIYPLLGFKEIHFLESFEGYDTIRDYISDRGMFDWVIDLFEDNSRQGGQPLFLFGVTMQNHGGYEYTGDNFTSSVKLEGYSSEYPKVEQYLSLIHETDRAVRYLIEYFSKTDRDIVLVFYGDHLPRLDESFYEELHGGKFAELEEKQLRYEVPFFIWTSYLLEEREISLTSFNYLSSYVYEAAGIPLPGYNRFLQDVEKYIPVINSQGYYSLSEQRFKTLGESEGREYELLNQYNILEYNSLFDFQNESRIFGK